MVWDIKRINKIFEMGVKVVADTMGDYYFRERKGRYMFDARCPNMVLLTGTFVEKKTEHIYNQLKVDGYMVQLNIY